METIKKQRLAKWERIVLFGLLVVAFGLAIWQDLPISAALYSKGNLFGSIFEMTAEIPTYALGIFAAALVTRFIDVPKHKIWTIVLKAVFLIATVGLSIYGGNHLLKLVNRNMGSDLPKPYLALFSSAFFFIAAPWCLLFNKGWKREALIFAFSIALLFALNLAIMQGLKLLWLRPRYRTLVALYGSNASNYWKAVYEPQGFWHFADYGTPSQTVLDYLGIKKWSNEEFLSFPSGHTLNAVGCIAFCLASSFMPKLRGKEIFIRLFFYLFGAATAVSRIVAGAHNATDVIAGYLIALAVYELVTWIGIPLLTKLHDRIYGRN